jgi:hypothetical protein
MTERLCFFTLVCVFSLPIFVRAHGGRPFCAYEVSSERLEVVGSKVASPTGFEPVLPP